MLLRISIYELSKGHFMYIRYKLLQKVLHHLYYIHISRLILQKSA